MKEKKELNYKNGIIHTFVICLPFLVLYYFILIERKYSVLFGQQQFLVAKPMGKLEAIVFLPIFVIEIVILLFTIAIFLSWAFNKFIYANKYNSILICIGLILSSFISITIQFQVLRYFRDGIDLALTKNLGGNSIVAAIQYAESELKGLLVPIYSSGIIALILVFLMIRFHTRISKWFDFLNAYQFLVSIKWLIIINSFLILLSGFTNSSTAALDKSLSWSMAHYAYKLPLTFLTDFDRDGYNLIKKPIDNAPFTSNIHPFALEIIGNDLDENGVGGDLKKLTNRTRPAYRWDRTVLEQKKRIAHCLRNSQVGPLRGTD